MTEELRVSEPEVGRRLWTPWRMSYIGGSARETGCIFCNRFSASDDVSSLILHRTEHSFAIMNLFPYNTGHVMIVPNQHIASPEDASSETLTDMAGLLPVVLRSLRRVLNCQGFNVGLNVGSIAGAGIAEHLHQHVVPRWNGDANFMPIIGSAMVIPELIPASYAKIRAELVRELKLASDVQVTAIVLDPDKNRCLVDSSGSFPTTRLDESGSVWKTAVDHLAECGIGTSAIGWAGENSAGSASDLVLTLTLESEIREHTFQWIDLGGSQSLPEATLRLLQRSLSQLSPMLKPIQGEE